MTPEQLDRAARYLNENAFNDDSTLEHCKILINDYLLWRDDLEDCIQFATGKR